MSLSSHGRKRNKPKTDLTNLANRTQSDIQRRAAELLRPSRNNPIQPRQAFLAAANNTIPLVSNFAEELVAALTGGKVVSHDEDLGETCDVYVEEIRCGIQVKSANNRHAARPLLTQVERLYDEARLAAGFLITIRSGFYAIVHYRGISTKGKTRGRSLLLSKRLLTEQKRLLIAHELQSVYLIDVRLLNHLATSPDWPSLRKNGTTKVWAERKRENRERRYTLYLNRTFLGGFVSELPEQVRALSDVFGTGKSVREIQPSIKFMGQDGTSFTRSIPVKIIGSSKSTLALSKRILSGEASFELVPDSNQPLCC